MRKSILFAAVASLALAACGGAAEAPAETGSETVAAAESTVTDLGGTPSGPVFTENQGDTLALSGYDAVSYFVGDGVPVEGSEEFTVKYQGYDYRFASEDNASTFAADPAKYVPAYGGYCAWAIGANNALAPGDPNVYEIVDGTLYLNFNEDVQKRWEPKKDEFIKQGDENYPTHDASEHYKA
ncbi:YHS domain-containing (seleno)protein [Alterisphingorhabdus coralli]|uniref:YHS domain-containing (Seleno)protein n=1 Tax=Alterisphingorhabdus coralli TaxID=3071408 RepID=A0AA97I0K8_9SPHN|nr:YHS domain-containing (seleno)protein [Parasphingorhabdus sp. SCSIO 66989]WOE74310.1 YHS domain-containing (seleno)protein [Parasphingorhabdus sp. SCSIO 66989]